MHHSTALNVKRAQVAQCTLEAHSFNIWPTVVLPIPKYTVISAIVCIVRPHPITHHHTSLCVRRGVLFVAFCSLIEQVGVSARSFKTHFATVDLVNQ